MNSTPSTCRKPSEAILALSLLALAASGVAQTVNIRGTVHDATTNAVVSGAKVELKTSALSATTDAKGFFEIKKTSALVGQLVSDVAARVRVEGSNLFFTVPDGAAQPVSIEVADLVGRSVLLFDGPVAPGTYSLPLPEKLPRSGVHLLRSSIGSAQGSLKIFRSGDQILSSNEPVVAGREAATVWDTLIVGKTGYETVRMALATSTDSLPKINLKPTSTAVPTIASLNAEVVGFATQNGGTTGGGNATPTTVTTCAELKAAAADKSPRVILISGTIKTSDCNGGYGLPIASNKTVQGVDKNATVYGGLYVNGGVKNVIIRNLNCHGIYPNAGADDAVHVQGATNVWLDHLNIWDATDGNLDITGEADYVTVSWCKFWYTDANHPHRLNALIGSGGGDHPEDWGKLHVTYHHNWFADLVNERMPRLMYGHAHVYNDYYTSKGNGYFIGFGSYGSVLVENNYFKGVNNPISFMYDVYAWIVQRGNTFDNTTGTGKDLNGKQGGRAVAGQDFAVAAFDKAPYAFTLSVTADVPNLVGKYAGPQ